MSMNNGKNRNSSVNAVFAILWIAILLTGLTLMATARFINWPRPSRADVVENRNLAKKPQFRKIPVKTWGRETEEWYDDHFAFRRPIINFYKNLHFKVFKSPVKRFVPGRGNWIFGRMGNDGASGDVWPEVEDYMGIVKLDEKMINDWKTLFEGRVAWAEAHGVHYLEVIPPMKSNVHPEKMLPMIAAHKKETCHEDLRDALTTSTASSNVLFLIDSLQAEVDDGKEVFYEEDHHENAYGCYCIYRDITARMRDLWYPELVDFPFFEDEIPGEVKSGKAPGCWVNESRRLEVSNPEMAVTENTALNIRSENPRFPHGAVCVARDTDGINVLVGHDSFLRYPFQTWHSKKMQDFAIPAGPGVGKVSLLIFTRFTTPKLDDFISKELPDVIIEQFSEGRLQFGTNGKGYDFLDETMRRAAAWSHGVPVSAEDAKDASNVMALAVLENVKAHDKRHIVVELRDANDKILATEKIKPGIRRAVFFGDIVPSSGIHVVISRGSADSFRLELKTKP